MNKQKNKKVILHIPHASAFLPSNKGYIPNISKITEEILYLTDWFTDDLFQSEKDITIKADFSRIFCDVERFENDNDEIMSKVGMGVLYERFDDGSLLRTITTEFRHKVIMEYYHKHHNNLTKVVKEQLELYGSALIIDCHSFPSTPLIRDIDQKANRPDFNIGTDSFHTPKELIDISMEYFKTMGYSLGIDSPYQGTIVPMEYYKTNKKVSSIMLEVNRKLYLKEPTNEKSSEFLKTKKIVQGFIELIKK